MPHFGSVLRGEKEAATVRERVEVASPRSLTIAASADRMSRRAFLRIGALGLGGLSLGDVLRLRAQTPAADVTKPKSVILVYLAGGPSHMDMYDMKPAAPAEFRGEFKPITTNVPGIQICEHMPLQAKMADRFAIIRGLEFSGSHGSHEVHTGFRRARRPVFGSVVSRVRGGRGGRLPYVNLGGYNHLDYTDPGDPAYLGTAHRPFMPNGQDQRNLQLHRDVTADRLADRRALLGSFDTLRRDLDAHGEMAGLDAFQTRAAEMIGSTAVRDALDIRQEPTTVRDRYGKEGDLLLLARRLVEAGTGVVTLSAPFRGAGGDNWDTHRENFVRLRRMLPVYDQALTALLADLHDRGLDREVAVLVCGEMGRAPRIGISTGATPYPNGRDHWQTGFALLAGGGLRTGIAVGETDGRAERSRGRPFTMQNVLATLYHLLGIDPAMTFPDHSGRPQYLLDDREPINELL